MTVNVHGKFRLLTPILAFVFGGQTLPLTRRRPPRSSTCRARDCDAAARTGRRVHGSPRTGGPGLTVSFDSSASTGNPTGFQWDLDGNGVVDSTDPNPTHTYNAAGTYKVTLTVVNLTGVESR